MSFRKRNVAVAQPGVSNIVVEKEKVPKPGTRPSPLDGRSTVSTGTSSLDALLAGHAGLALGTSLLIEENGTTDFGGVLLRYYASEGIVQGHHVHVLGMTEAWGRELPGLATESASKRTEEKRTQERMKIAWRYERLGEFGTQDKSQSAADSQTATDAATFCHNFDLSKRLVLPESAKVTFVPLSAGRQLNFAVANSSSSPFVPFLQHLAAQLSAAPSAIHRVVIPSLLSPALYPGSTSRPDFVLQFLHGLRALLRQYSPNLTAMISLPLALFPRSTGLTRWMEILADGVLELAPFHATAVPVQAPKASTVQEEPPQGILKVHSLPIFHEKGGGGEVNRLGDDLAFTLSRRKGLTIKPFNLPPVEGDLEGSSPAVLEHDHGKVTKVDLEF